jgi:hypothetical protein
VLLDNRNECSLPDQTKRLNARLKSAEDQRLDSEATLGLHEQTLVFTMRAPTAAGAGMGDTARQPDDFALAFDSAFAALQVRIESACAAAEEWPAQVADGIRAAFEWAAAEPVAAQLLTNDALAGGSAGFERYERMIAYVAELLEPGRGRATHGERLPEITERAMASGVAMLVAQRLSLNKQDELPAIAGEAIQFVLTPYLGGAEARRAAVG